MTINFASFKDSDQTHTMHTKSDNIEIMIGIETDEITEELFDSLLQRYQIGLEEKMRGSEFIFRSADLLYYRFHKMSLNRGGSYINLPDWLKNKKAIINSKNNGGKYFPYAITAALNLKQIKSHLERI